MKDLRAKLETLQADAEDCLLISRLATDRAKSMEAGCDDYDTKPVDFTKLQKKIDNLILEKKTI